MALALYYGGANGYEERDALLEYLRGVDAVLIRSATRMDAEAIAAAPQLKVIARAGVGLGVHRHGAVAEFLGGAHHPAGDLATVGDEDGIEHGSAPRGDWR